LLRKDFKPIFLKKLKLQALKRILNDLKLQLTKAKHLYEYYKFDK
jgi:hypothetical protein